MKFVDLASAMNGRHHPEDREVTVNRAVIDSREAGPGSLFFALKGEKRDGHEFVDDVLAGGGCAVIARDVLLRGTILVDDVERAMLLAGAWCRELITCPVVGVTGSSGKTTTRELIMSALRGTYITGGTQANLNNHLGLPLTLLNMPEGIEAAVLEMGMNHPGELLVLGEVARPDMTVITNIGIAHMEFFETRDDVVRAKAELLLTTKRGGFTVIPVAEPLLAEAALDRDLDVITIGEGGDLWLNETDGRITAEPFGLDLRLALAGKFNCTNALFAIAIARALGVEPGLAIERMSAYAGMAGRGRILNCSGVRIMDESYNANPNSTTACLRALADMESGRIAVLGDMLELGRTTAEMHRAVLELADSMELKALILTGRHYAAASSCLEKTQFVLTGSWQEALQMLREIMSSGDTVLVKGSHSLEMSRIVASLEEES